MPTRGRHEVQKRAPRGSFGGYSAIGRASKGRGPAESEAGYSSRSPDISLHAAESRRPRTLGSSAQTDGASSAYRAVDETFLGLRFSGIFQSALYLEASVVPISILIAVLAAGVSLGGMILEQRPLDRKRKKPPERGCEARALSPDRSGPPVHSRLGSATLASLRDEVPPPHDFFGQ